jgi:hypothetical protein
MSFLPVWKSRIDERQARIIGLDGVAAQKIMVSAALVMVLRACWVWGAKSWGVGREWWEERERRERFKVWIVEERRVRRERMCVLGILRGKNQTKVVRKRVAFAEDGGCGQRIGEAGGNGDLEGQKKMFGKRELLTKEAGCSDLPVVHDSS